ncbi:MAG: ABC transporter permease [Fibrobacter sp.]|nr:ABC transporter permease [Fibrobacter sp.]
MNFILSSVSRIGATGSLIGRKAADFLRSVNRYGVLFCQTFSRMHLLFKNPDITVSHMFTLGIESLPLVSVIALFLGSEVVIQSVYQMQGFAPMRYLGVLVCKSIVTELGPVITAMVFAGRVATGIAAEIGSMKTSEQLEAMQVLSLDSIRYLIVPKTAACMIMLPALVIWAEFLAIMGALFMVIISVDITLYSFLNGLKLFFAMSDVFIGILKTSVFGAIIAITGAHFGFETRGGAEGVGNATTQAVVTSAVLILIFDFLIALLVW